MRLRVARFVPVLEVAAECTATTIALVSATRLLYPANPAGGAIDFAG